MALVNSFRKWLVSKRLEYFDGGHVINYLSEIPKERVSEFGMIRSAINTTVHQNSGFNYSDLLIFRRHANGYRRSYPLEPKYEEMWDISLMWNCLREDFWWDKPAKRLRTRANILVRLSVAGRNSDVAYIHRPSVQWAETFVTFKFFQWKSQGTTYTRFSRPMTLRKVSDEKICAFSALKQYFEYHNVHFQVLQSNGIWLSYNGSKEVQPQTLAMCTQEVMRRAGIDPMFGVATLRHAAITFWRNQGVSLEEVMERTGHRSKQLVMKYYDRSNFSVDIMANIIDDYESDEEFEGEVSQ